MANTLRCGFLAVFLAAAIFGPTTVGGQQAPYDLLIRNGHIVDGTGNPWFAGDVAVRGDRIVAVGRLTGASAKREIDAKSTSVAPRDGLPEAKDTRSDFTGYWRALGQRASP
jgi:hypothetical protein